MKRIQRPEVNDTILQGSYRVCLEKVWRSIKNGRVYKFLLRCTVTKLGQMFSRRISRILSIAARQLFGYSASWLFVGKCACFWMWKKENVIWNNFRNSFQFGIKSVGEPCPPPAPLFILLCSMYDVTWHCDMSYVRSKDAQEQLAGVS